MKKRNETIAAAVGQDPDVARQLDQLLQHPDDRAFLVCERTECLHNSAGRCTIYAIRDQRPAGDDKPCPEYRQRN